MYLTIKPFQEVSTSSHFKKERHRPRGIVNGIFSSKGIIKLWEPDKLSSSQGTKRQCLETTGLLP